MKILVTGATGFIGRHVVNSLLNCESLQITVTGSNLSKLHDCYADVNVNILPYDIHEGDTTLDLYEYFGAPDKLIHLAWRGLPNYGNTFHMVENLAADVRFIQSLVDAGLKDITITGTCFEYGMQEGELSEVMASAPANFYALAKDSLRRTLEIYQKQKSFDLKWVRLFYLYGRGQQPNSLIAQLNSALLNGDLCFNMSGGMQIRDFLKVEDAAFNIGAIALQNEVVGIINNCSGNAVRLIDFVNSYLSSKKLEIKLNLGYYPYSSFEPMEFWGSRNKLDSILNKILKAESSLSAVLPL
jgi:nucleoside-diphosphate-sugar epimerase